MFPLPPNLCRVKGFSGIYDMVSYTPASTGQNLALRSKEVLGNHAEFPTCLKLYDKAFIFKRQSDVHIAEISVFSKKNIHSTKTTENPAFCFFCNYYGYYGGGIHFVFIIIQLQEGAPRGKSRFAILKERKTGRRRGLAGGQLSPPPSYHPNHHPIRRTNNKND